MIFPMKFFLVPLLALPLLAQSTPNNVSVVPGTAVNNAAHTDAVHAAAAVDPAQQVSMAQVRLRDAATAGDTDTLKSLLDDDCSFTLPTGQVFNKKHAVHAFRSIGTAYPRLELSDVRVRMAAPTVGVVTAKIEAKGEAAFRMTAVWQKEAAGWKAIVIQATPAL
jgi:ketosteroid isomerase-like protein